MQISLLNGQPDSLELSHRALGYGDGLFETILFYQQSPMFLDAHLLRLCNGAKRLKLRWDHSDRADLEQQIGALMDGVTEPHVIKIMLLRNFPGRGYGFEPDQQSTDVILQIQPYNPPPWTGAGVHTHLAQTPVTENTALAGLKHMNRLDSVLARAEFPRNEIQEVFLAGSDGMLAEGSMSNVVVLTESGWRTPVIDKGGVRGVIRQHLLDRGLIQEASVSIESIDTIQSAFITGSLIGIVPVLTYNQRPLSAHQDIELFKQELGFPW